MITPAFEPLIAVFDRLLPTIRQQYGSTWAVIAEDRLAGAFAEFEDAVRFAAQRFDPGGFLIRHTGGVMPYIPFVAAED